MSKDIIDETIAFGAEIQVIIDKYNKNPDLYQNMNEARRDTTWMASMLFYFNPRQALLEVDMENLIDTRKRKKSWHIKRLIGEVNPVTGKLYTNNIADHQARVLVAPLDKKIADYRRASKYAKAMMFAVQRFMDQLDRNLNSLAREMRRTGDA